MIRPEQEIRDKIKKLESDYSHVLKGSFATIVENAPRALMQLEAKARLQALYYTLKEKCPQYEYERRKK